MSNTLQLELESLHQFGRETLSRMLSTAQLVEVHMTNQMLGFAQDPNDVAYEYLKALYVGEGLFPFCKNMQAREIRKDGSHPNYFIVFEFSPIDVEHLSEQLLYFSTLVGEGDDDDKMLELAEELSEFEDYVKDYEVHFPEIERLYHKFLNDEEEGDDEDV